MVNDVSPRQSAGRLRHSRVPLRHSRNRQAGIYAVFPHPASVVPAVFRRESIRSSYTAHHLDAPLMIAGMTHWRNWFTGGRFENDTRQEPHRKAR